MSGQGAFNYNQSKQNSQSYSGLRGTPGFNQFAVDYGNLGNKASSLASSYASSPFGFFQGQSIDRLAPINPGTGLPNELNNAMGSMASQMFSKASAGGAMNGQVQPESTSGVVGSSLNNIGQFLTPYVMDYAKYRQQLPDQLMSSRLGMLQNTLGSMSPGLGSESNYHGSSFGFGVSGGGGAAPQMSSGCWIAGVLYGEGSDEQIVIRKWLRQQNGFFWDIVNTLYMNYGQQVAQFITPWPILQAIFAIPFNWMLKKAIYG